jgi:S1-C subfamily serine protease
MMRENESESGDGWAGPYDYISPWAARDTEAAGTGPEAESGRGDTIDFGRPTDEPGQGWYVQRDPWYGSSAGPDGAYGSGSGGYGSDGYGSGSGGSGSGGSGSGSGGSGSGSGGYGSGGGAWDPGPPPPRARRRGHTLVYLTVGALAACVGAGLTVAFSGSDSPPSASTSARNIPSSHHNHPGTGPGLNRAAVERKVEPGLVDITSMLTFASETAEGTGMILSASGLVLTNNHVIDGATSIKVSLAQNARRTYPARVVGYDSTDDVAVLQITGASGLATVSFGDSSQVRVGTAILALGDAEGRGPVTPAPGAISGLDRSIQASDEGSGDTENLNDMLQTNAQIQQGDSGGALADSAGQVIGMITAANTGAGGQQGGTTGFAIPINSALAIARQIRSGQPTSRVYIGLPGFLGVEVAQSNSANPRRQAVDGRSGPGHGGPSQGGQNQGQPAGRACLGDGQQPRVPEQIAPARAGALIMGVLCGTAAQSRGLAPGDVIISVDGQAVTTPGSLTAITARYHPGDVVTVHWEATNGSQHTARIKLGNGPARLGAAR